MGFALLLLVANFSTQRQVNFWENGQEYWGFDALELRYHKNKFSPNVFFANPLCFMVWCKKIKLWARKIEDESKNIIFFKGLIFIWKYSLSLFETSIDKVVKMGSFRNYCYHFIKPIQARTICNSSGSISIGCILLV